MRVGNKKIKIGAASVFVRTLRGRVLQPGLRAVSAQASGLCRAGPAAESGW